MWSLCHCIGYAMRTRWNFEFLFQVSWDNNHSRALYFCGFFASHIILHRLIGIEQVDSRCKWAKIRCKIQITIVHARKVDQWLQECSSSHARHTSGKIKKKNASAEDHLLASGSESRKTPHTLIRFLWLKHARAEEKQIALAVPWHKTQFVVVPAASVSTQSQIECSATQSHVHTQHTNTKYKSFHRNVCVGRLFFCILNDFWLAPSAHSTNGQMWPERGR